MNKPKPKLCRNEGCNNSFTPFKSTDKFCSYKCAKANAPEPKPRTEIKKESTKRKAENFVYSKLRKQFMAKPENKICVVAKEIFGEDLNTTEVHHRAGKIGRLLNYVPYWLAVSRKAHDWIHDNPKESYKRGYLIQSSTVNI